MKKKLLLLGLGFCLLAAACSGKKTAKEDAQPNQSEHETADSQEEKADGSKEDGNTRKDEQDISQEDKEDDSQAATGKELSKAPEVTFTDYSQDIKDEDNGVLMLSVMENCPVISIEENQDIAQRMNMVFEQQHITNQDEITRKAQEAKDYYKSLSEEEAAAWSGYGYGMNYKVMYASTRILSIEAEGYDWQGSTHPNTWTSSYCFDVTTGDLLYLADILTNEEEARKIVSQHILDTVTKEPYKDALLDDYESYVADVLTENTFYLNEKGLVVICNPYMVTAYVAGTIEVEIPYEELKDVMNEKYLIEN